MGAQCGKEGKAMAPQLQVSMAAPGIPLPEKAAKQSARALGVSRSLFIQHGDGRLEDTYEVGQKKGEGTQGTVFIATRKSDGAKRAVKQVPKTSIRKADVEAFKKEVEIMKGMDHPNIIKLYDTYEDRKSYFLVMELCTGGELLDRIIEQGHLTESQAAVVVKQVLRSVFYMHENSIAHRDLKPENFLLAREGPIDDDNLIKLIDFGIACECRKGQLLSELAGTAFYCAPQVVMRRYDKTCDLWSVGVILYTLICGNVPFNGSDDMDIMQKVRQGVVNYREKDWSRVSPHAKDLARRLLMRSPKERISAEGALNHAWIKATSPQLATPLPAELLRRLNEFRSLNVFQKAALQMIAGEMSDGAVKEMRNVFVSMDANGDGKLSVAEVTRGIQESGMEVPSNLREILEGVDADRSGIVDYTEFLAATLDYRDHLSEQVCREVFSKFDLDNSGVVNCQELSKSMTSHRRGTGKFVSEAEKVIGEWRSEDDEDGTMSFQNFVRMMRGGSASKSSRGVIYGTEPATSETPNEPPEASV